MAGDTKESSKSEEKTYLFLGNIHGSHLHDGYAGAVFDIHGVSPGLTTCQGGGRQPHVLLVRKYEQSK